MKIVVIGGTGLIGSRLVTVLSQRGHQVVSASPQSGVNTLTGEGLEEALDEAEVVVDLANSPTLDGQGPMDFFVTSGRNLMAAEAVAGVKHHVVLSVVGADRMAESDYMRAKVAQENMVRDACIPYTVVRSTQFFEFVGRITMAAADGDVYRLSPALVQPIAADDVVAALAEFTLAPPCNAIVEIAGPEAVPLDELARELLTAHEDPAQIVADVHARYFGAELNDRSLIPGPGARLASTTFDDWLRQSITAD